MPSGNWTIDRVRSLIGSSETVRLEFKASKLFQQPPDKVAETLAREVSAFANTEGGALVVGLEEDKGTRTARRVDEGVSVQTWPRERVQQLVEGNISPYLVGLRVYALYAEPRQSDRAIYVIEVPAGRTAYQAKDRIYWGRSEYETKALPDNEVRVRMLRTQIAQAAVVINSATLVRAAVEEVPLPPLPPDAPSSTASQEDWVDWALDHFGDAWARIDARMKREKLAASGKFAVYDEYRVRYSIRNVGLLSILAGFVELRVLAEASCADGSRSDALPPGFKLFPDQEHHFPDPLRLRLASGRRFAPGALPLGWRVFLDNSPPSAGIADLYDMLPGEAKAAE